VQFPREAELLSHLGLHGGCSCDLCFEKKNCKKYNQKNGGVVARETGCHFWFSGKKSTVGDRTKQICEFTHSINITRQNRDVISFFSEQMMLLPL
jgi:hypothetical protein